MARNLFNIFLLMALIVGVVVAGDRVALAAPPSNDLRSGARLITVGFSESLDTTEATTDGDDVTMNSNCNFSATAASVWYKFVGTGEKVSLNVFQSDFSAGVIASPHLSTAACGWGGVDFYADAGVTYYILAFDRQDGGGGTGGTLNISITLAPPDPPPPAVALTVNPYGTVNARTGVVSISGTYSCVDADSFYINPNIWQSVGVFFTVGFADVWYEGSCNGVTNTWSADIYPLLDDPVSRKFVGGPARVMVSANSYGVHGYGEGAYIDQTVILRGK